MVRELSGVNRIHLMGIGGAGMASLAILFAGMGCHVSGCDLNRGASIEELETLGIACVQGHSPEHIERFQPQLLVYSSAIDEHCGEIEAAHSAGIRTVGRGEALSWLFNEAEGIGVAGTHGKTTTSSMISLILSRAGLSPTIYVGGKIRDMGISAALGKGRFFLSELDESDGSFEFFHPSLSIVTNVDWDHVDHFPSLEDVVMAFVRFASGRKRGAPLVVCAEDEGAQRMLQALERQGAEQGKILRYGWGKSWDWSAFDLRPKPSGGISCVVCRMGEEVGRLELAVSGEHNVLNALASLAAADALGVPFAKAAEILKDFHGAARRLQAKGERNGVLVVDDYAHHPTEVAASLAAVRGICPERRLLLLFQPHRFTRTAALVGPLSEALRMADEVFLLPIYSAGETALPVSSEELADRIRGGGGSAVPCTDPDDALERLTNPAREGDVLLTMGAGNVFRVGERFLECE